MRRTQKDDRITTTPSFLEEPRRVEEPRAAEEFSDVLTHVASEGRPVIVRRNGADLAAVIPVEHLELVREGLAREQVERLAEQIDWDRAAKTPPPRAWFEADDNPFEP